MIDGNYGSNNTGSGIYINNPYLSTDAFHTIRSILIITPRDDGIKIEGDTRGVNIINIQVKAGQRYGFDLGGSDHKLLDCDVSASLNDGFYNIHADTLLTQCKAFYCGSGSGAGFTLTGRGFLVNCQAEDNYRDGIVLSGSTTA